MSNKFNLKSVMVARLLPILGEAAKLENLHPVSLFLFLNKKVNYPPLYHILRWILLY